MAHQHKKDWTQQYQLWDIRIKVAALLVPILVVALPIIWKLNSPSPLDVDRQKLIKARDEAAKATNAVLHAENVNRLQDSIGNLNQAVSYFEAAQVLLNDIPGDSPIGGEVKAEKEKNTLNLAKIKSVLIELPQKPVPIGSANLCVAKQVMYGNCEKMKLR